MKFSLTIFLQILSENDSLGGERGKVSPTILCKSLMTFMENHDQEENKLKKISQNVAIISRLKIV